MGAGADYVSHSKQPVELTGSTVTQDAQSNDCVRVCGETSITGGRAVGGDFAEVPIASGSWTDLLATFSNVLVVSVQNKSAIQVKLNVKSSLPAGYEGIVLEPDSERFYNDLDTGFELSAKSASGTPTLNVEVLKNA